MASPRKTSKAGKTKKWKKAGGVEEVTVPSDNVARVRRPGMETFLMEGLFPNTLMPLVQDAVRKGKGLPPEKMKELTDDPSMVAAMLDSMDRIVARIVVEPKVLWHKEVVVDDDGKPVLLDGVEQYRALEESERDEYLEKHDLDAEDVLWTDEVEFTDKAFLFNYAVGGTRDLERFREQAESGLASVSPEQAVGQST